MFIEVRKSEVENHWNMFIKVRSYNWRQNFYFLTPLMTTVFTSGEQTCKLSIENNDEIAQHFKVTEIREPQQRKEFILFLPKVLQST